MPYPALTDGRGGEDLAGLHQCMHRGKALTRDLEVGQQRGRARHIDDGHRRTGMFEFRGYDLASLAGYDGERDKRRRHIKFLERTGHRVLTADGGSAELQLGIERTEESDERLTPARWLTAEFFEILLKRQAGAGGITTGSRQAGQGLHHRTDRAVAGRPLSDLRVEPVGHDGADIGFSAQDRQLGRHGFLGGGLGRPAEGVQDRISPDRGIKTLYHAPLGGIREVG